MQKLGELFHIEYGNKLDLNKMRSLPVADGGVQFVGRASEDNGVTASVAPLLNVTPYEAGLVTVALGGSKLLSAFVQNRSFYTAQNVAVLKPLPGVNLTFAEKVYLCVCIRHNRSRYSAFGREANRTIKDILVPSPDEFPSYINGEEAALGDVAAPMEPTNALPLLVTSWHSFRLDALFAIKKGRRIIRRERESGPTPFVGASTKCNGIVGYVKAEPMFSSGSISIPYNGNGVGCAFYQPTAYCASDDVQVLEPLPQNTTEIDQAALMFVCVVLRCERYRYSFGRKWHLARMRETTIRLPAMNGVADWSALSKFVKSLPFSSAALKSL